ncbi:MAG: response regulator transcription factor [Vagococcus sp.]
MNTNKILIVDDDPMIRKLTWKSFQSTGILIYQADSIDSALSVCDRVTFDLFLLDIILDYENDGYFLAQTLRERFPMTPIIFLSGRTNESDIVTGLENGADYYITKPFSPILLRTQVISTLERYKTLSKHASPVQSLIHTGIFSFDKKTHSFFKLNKKIDLSSKESALMIFFLENPNQVFSKEQIFSSVWSEDSIDSNLISVYISYLRNKIEDDPKKPIYLKTVWGIGYSFIPESADISSSK